MSTMRISQLAERTGVPATTLRFYETAGLLPTARTASGYRMYGEDAIERLAFINAAKHLGLPLEEIADLLAVWEAGACADVKADLRPRVAARRDEAERRIAELAAFTASLTRALAHLDALPDRPDHCDQQCGFLNPTAHAGPVPVHLTRLPDDRERWRTAPVACSLTGDAKADRAERWRQMLADADADRDEIDGGVRLTLPAQRAAELAALAVDEQQCCPFFDVRLHLDGPVVHLEVRAPAEGTALLADLFAPA